MVRTRVALGAVAVLFSSLSVLATPNHVAAATAITPNGTWSVYHHDDGHTGNDSTQPSAATARTGWTSPALDESVYGEPLVYNGIVYVATLNNTVYALNQTDGSVAWSRNLRAPETGGWGCGNVSPQGILGTPVIDQATGRIYAATLGSDDVYRLEGLNLTTGVDELDTVITTPASGFDWTIEQERGALAVRNGYVYVPFGGRAGDCGTYHGYVFAVPTDGSAVTHYYQTPGAGAGFWNAGGMVVDDSTGDVFNTSGNGVSSGCNANANGTPVYENDAVVAFSPTLAHLGAFIPQDWQNNWCGNDADLGSASMVLISPTLAFQSGKWGDGFLVNPQALGGMDGQLYPNPKPATYSGAAVCYGNTSDANFGSYAYSAPYVYLSCDGHGLVGLKVTATSPVSFSGCDSSCASPTWRAGGTTSFGPPIVAGNAVWAVSTGGGGLYGFDAGTGAQIYHSAGFGATHFTTPSEAGGQIFVGSGNAVRSFDMVSGCVTAGVSPDKASPQTRGVTITFTATSTGCAGPQYEYWFKLPSGSYALARAYGGATLAWDTHGAPIGTYQVIVWVRQTGSSASYETYALISYTLNSDCTAAGVTPDKASPQARGATVTFTATSGCNNPQYEYWFKLPSGSYVLTHAYDGATLAWNTTGAPAGTYQVIVWVRDVGESVSWDTYALISYTLT